jgi:hypothetical protein
LTLWKNQDITIADLAEDTKRGKLGSRGIRKAVNKLTGKESLKALAFGDTNWGQTSRDYIASVEGLPARAWEKVLTGASEYVKASERGGGSSASGGLGDPERDDDGRAQLVYISDNENEGEGEQIRFPDALLS